MNSIWKEVCRTGTSLLALLVGMAVFVQSASAQQAGSPTITPSSFDGTHYAYSNAYIDASASGISGSDICAKIHYALVQLSSPTNYPNGSGVIDARGVSVGTACSSTSGNSGWGNPWSGFTTPPAPGATILLPAGTIQINTQWILPSGTRLIGQGGEDPGLNPSGVKRTTIQAGTTGFPGSYNSVIQMGVNVGCYGVSIEDLVVDGQGLSGSNELSGIANQYCLDGSFVRGVTLYQIVDAGLSIGANDDDISGALSSSGPYSNITFDTGNLATSITTNGIYLGATTRGIQGVTCTNSNIVNGQWTGVVGICVNVAASGNSVQDVRVEGFDTGVNVAASDVVLMNIDGDTNPTSGGTTGSTLYVVKVAGGQTSVAMMGISNNCVNPQGNSSYCSDPNDYTIYDNSIGSTADIRPLTFTNDPFVAMYVIGNWIDVNSKKAFSRFTTSPSAANWSVGLSGISGSCTTPGSLYSNTNSDSTHKALYVCSAVTGVGWVPIQ
jgi:hypothetical protein